MTGAMELADTIRQLGALIARCPDRAFFDGPASEADIAGTEAAIGRALPDAYKQFLRAHNGGFIAQEAVTERDEATLDAEAWNANHLLGCDAIRHEYRDAFLIARDVEPDLGDWPFIPFCQTEGQETLVFGPPGPNGIAPVLDAFHEVGADEWGVLAPGFHVFLNRYVDTEGFPETIALTNG